MSAIVSCLGVTQTECGCSSNSLCVCTPCKIATYNSNSIPCMTAVAISDTNSVTLVNNLPILNQENINYTNVSFIV